MKILALETSATAASVAICEDEALIAQSFQRTGLTHSATLMPMVESMLSNTNITMKDIDIIAVAAGPGSFTGLRIGVSAAKGLAWGNEIPCYGVSTLEAMALGLGVQDSYVLPTMDARRSQVYTALFAVENGIISRLFEDSAIALSELKEKLPGDKPIFLVGDGSNLTYNTLHSDIPNLILPPEHKMHQRAVGVGLAANKAIAAGDVGDAASLTPNYLRLSQAERERLEKNK